MSAKAPAPSPHDWAAGVRTQVSDITGRGGRIIFLGLAGFVAWAALFPLNSAVLAPGMLAAQGQNKLLQHRTGGTVREILAIEGDRLKAGEPIVALDPNVSRAELTRLRARYALAVAMKTRLEAEQGETAEPVIQNGSLLRGGLDGASQAIDLTVTTSTRNGVQDAGFDASLADAQQREFDQGRQAVGAELRGLQQRIAAQEEQRRGLAGRLSRLQEQIALLRRQYNAARSLVARDYLPKQQMWDLETRLLEREAEMQGVRAEHDAAANSIAETRSQAERVLSVDQRASSEKMSQVLTDIEEVGGQLVAAEAALSDTVVRAPVDGVLVHSKAKTIGGVIAPGVTFGEIVPADANLEIAVRVQPKDITHVRVGGKARVKITALNMRLFDDIPAEVIYVAADATVDERTGERYFEVRAALDKSALQAPLATMLTPGMAGEALLEGESRTFLSYLAQPLTDSLSRAFKETQ